ncbi:hypothetical protein AT05_04080 [Schleiferia thermophila str. Yellowstone]|jgi:ATP-dependent exoDNAse (exonuclease V) beta subunit|uniref:UvrD-helicase domain-containing protein n=1 Tax=Schleiferia thermophila TaxID=884107 RepID=UPI0004E6EF0C|nr:UvrD-helicase domain-containing protein [Schleiferia thermophila]KFD39560.1 hypothetical protein AT05_04080 [Schleiferia thermophila str. Yellowstone]
MDSPFVIYSASAGSGKTFTLASDYISICLTGPSNVHRQILAITFTNKAAEEMKERILKNLQKLAAGDSSENFQAFKAEIEKKTNLSDNILKKKAERVLFEILHDMSGFHVITIDKFFLKLYKAFTAELLTSWNKAPGVDETYIQTLAIDSLISELGTNSELTKFFEDYLNITFNDSEYIRDPTFILQEITKKISDEKAELFLNNFQNIDYKDFNDTITKLREHKKLLLNEVNQINECTKKIFSKHNLKREDCSRGTLYKLFFEELSSEEINLNDTINKLQIISNKIKNNEFQSYLLNSSLKNIENINSLAKCFESSASKLLARLIKVRLIENILKLSSLLILLRDIEKKIKEVSEEENQVLLSEISATIHAFIRNEAADFIFEKLGNRYHYIFIDEFQDTSSRQWENIKPLAHEILAKNGTLKLIGDPKQSIYRFRNANSQLMIELLNHKKTPFNISPEKKVLDKNFRSAQEIVNFNNDFFSKIKKSIWNFEKDSYHDVVQNASSKEKGYVEIQALNSSTADEYEEATLNHVKEIIRDCIQRNYRYGNIAILVRSKAQGKKLADYFQQLNSNEQTFEKIPVSSQDSFAIKSNPKVKVLDNSLRLIKNPQEQLLKFKIAYDLIKLKIIDLNGQSEHQLYKEILNDNQCFFTYLLSTCKIQKNHSLLERIRYTSELRRIPVHELATQLVQFYFPNERQDPFIVAYLELVYDYVEKYRSSDIVGFLDYYTHQIDEDRSINASTTPDAVSIMTIHKAKGLEWPVVILPFFDYKTFQQEMHIIPLNPNRYFLGAALVHIYKNQNWPEEDDLEEMRKRYVQEQMEDAVNLMYVAFTRPKSELYISIKNKPYQDEISHLIKCTVFDGNPIASESSVYVKGVKATQKSKQQTEISPQPLQTETTTTHWRDKLKIARHYSLPQAQKISTGSKMHQILSQCNHLNDLKERIHSNALTSYERNILQKLVEFIDGNDELKAIYTAPKVVTERAILSNGQFVIPDAMALIGDVIKVVEYKTGHPSDAHLDQLRHYVHLLSQGGQKAEGYLLYLKEDGIEMRKISA